MLGPPLGPSIDMMSMASTFSSAVTITPWSISLFILFLFNCHERKMEKSLFYWQLSIPMFCTLYALRSAKQNLSIDFLCSSVLCLSFLSFCLKCRLLWLCHIQWFGSYACVAMHIVAEWEYLLGTMSTGIPRECLINVWLGILHRLVHIPTQFVSSKNLQGVGLMAKIPSAIKTLMMIWKWWWLLPLWWWWWKWRRREPWSIKLIGADWFTK